MATYPLSTPGSCCGHNLNMHDGRMEGKCVACHCGAFMPDGVQCRAECSATDGKGNLRCEIRDPEGTRHNEDHKATVDGGHTIRWTEAVAIYPLANPERAQVGNGSARLGQVGGEHYRKFKIQPWDVIDEYGLSFYAGNALKYLLRAGNKGATVEDLKKCRHYLDKLIEVEEARDGA